MRNNRKRTLQILTTSGLLLLAVSIAQAGTLVTNGTTYSDSLNIASLGAGYCVGPYATGSDCVQQATSVGSTPTPDTVTFLDPSASDYNFELWTASSTTVAGTEYAGNFNNGDMLIATVVASNQIEFQFGSAISAFDVAIQDYVYTDPFNAFIQVNDGGGAGTCAVASFCEVQSNATNNSGHDPIFIGVTSSSTFTTVLLTLTDTANSTNNNDYVLDDLSFTVGATNSGGSGPSGPAPEPSTIAMMVGGLGVLGWKARKRVKA